MQVGFLSDAGPKETTCRYCGACVEICPTGALRDKDNVPAVRSDKPLPCVGNCPAGIDIPQYLNLIAAGEYQKALNVIRSRVPFPGILGYICFHPCEKSCRRAEIDQAVAICDLKRFTADVETDAVSLPFEKRPDSGKKVAIVGSGPAGLTAACYLSLQGHNVFLFDREDKPGGMLRYGIPAFRLPPKILDRELKILDTLGINLKMNHRFEGIKSIDEFKSNGFDAILIAVGASVGKRLMIDNGELEGVHSGLDFLREVRQTKLQKLEGRVVVIGGGNVAIDIAMTAIRLGAESVDLVCLESYETMPAYEWEIAQAVEEGVRINPSLGPKRYIDSGGHVSAIGFVKCTRVFDENGRFDPIFDEDTVTEIPADIVIVAIGQEAEWVDLNGDNGFAFGIESTFIAGDVSRGPSSVIDAIVDGRNVADRIDKYLGGSGLLDLESNLFEANKVVEFNTTDDSFRQSRQVSAVLDVSQRKGGFDLITQTFSEQTARIEAGRCLRCNLRQQIAPVTLPPERWQLLNEENVATTAEIEGVFQLLDSEKKVIRITGTENIREGLIGCLENIGDARWFIWDEDPMYTKRESELIQRYLQKYGEMPGGGGGDDDLDDLF